MERTDKYSPPRLLPPVDASFKPTVKLTSIPAKSPLEDILTVIERDGGVILTDFVSTETLDEVEKDLEPHVKPIAESDSYDNFIGKKTRVVPGLIGKSDTLANVLDTNEVLDKLLKEILVEKYPAVWEQHTEELVIDPLLSLSVGFHISHDSPRQALHRDDMIFSSKHGPDMKATDADGFSCFIAGTKITRENGGTLIIPGSHKWEHHRRGKPEEVTFLEMERGSAFIFLGSVAHAAGYNTMPDEIRKIYALIFCRGNLRTEENQFLCNPRSKILNMSPKMQTLLGFKKPEKSWLGLVETEDPMKDLPAVYEKMLA